MLSSCFFGKGKWIIILTVCISSAQNGFFYMWPSIALRYTLNGDAGFTITEQELTNILNTFFVSKIVGVFAVSFSMDRFGRKWTLTGFTLFAIVGWLLILVGRNALMIMVARVFCGLYVSIQLSLVPVIIGETMEPDMRGSLSSMSVFFSLAANVLMSTLIVNVGYTWFNIITGLPCLLLLASSFFMIETPYYFLKIGEKENARKSILWLRGHSSEDDLNCMEQHSKFPSGKSGRFSSLLEKGPRRAFIIVVPILIAVTVGGVEVPYNYFFVLMPSHPIPAETSLIIGNSMCVVALVVSAFILDRLGRRLTTVVAFLGACIFHLASAVWYFNKDSAAHLGWFPPVALWFTSFFFYLALETFPRLMLSELFPLQLKGLASVVVTTIKAVLTIILNQSFYLIRNSTGEWLYFTLAGTFLGLGILLSYFLLPETTGKSLEGIQDDLSRGDNNYEQKAIKDGNAVVYLSTKV